jgi:hypothetical protein
MSLSVFTIEEKIDALHREIDQLRRAGFPPRSAQQRHYKTLCAILNDLRARQLPRSLPLGELERGLARVKASKTSLGYDQGQMINVAGILIQRWPFIQQALENFGAESME